MSRFTLQDFIETVGTTVRFGSVNPESFYYEREGNDKKNANTSLEIQWRDKKIYTVLEG